LVESDNKNITTFAKKDYLEFYLHGKNNFAERSKILCFSGYRSEK